MRTATTLPDAASYGILSIMKHVNIGFIGGGNMAHSLIGGLIADGMEAEKLWVSDPSAERLQLLQQEFSLHGESDNAAVCQACDVIVLAVKPQMLKAVCEELAASIDAQLVISIAAGVRGEAICRWLGKDVPLVRVMPNTPSLVQAGASGLFANSHVSTAQHDIAESILRAVGLTVWLDDEKELDVVTALSGSGPAYFFYLMESMQAAAVDLGLTEKQARTLTLQTAFGAAKMALESSDDPATLRHKVTSPGGTTEAAINQFETDHLRDSIARALQTAATRADELAQLLGED